MPRSTRCRHPVSTFHLPDHLDGSAATRSAAARNPFGPAAAAGRRPSVRTVQWQLLFEDLDAQFAAAQAEQARAVRSDLVRAERATTHLADRLRAAVGLPLRVQAGDVAVAGELLDVGEGWALLSEPPARQALVPVAAITAVAGLVPQVAPPPGRVGRSLGLSHALRALSRDRAEVQVCAAGRTLTGVIDRVGADHLDLRPAVGPPWTVPFGALLVVCSR